MTITVNGEIQTVSDGATILDLLTLRGVEPSRVVAEVNGSVVKQNDFGTHRLGDGDVLEIVRFVGGG